MLGNQCLFFFKKLNPAFHYIFFVIANEVKQSVETFNNRNNKKGCRCNRGYGFLQKLNIYQFLEDLQILKIIKLPSKHKFVIP